MSGFASAAVVFSLVALTALSFLSNIALLGYIMYLSIPV